MCARKATCDWAHSVWAECAWGGWAGGDCWTQSAHASLSPVDGPAAQSLKDKMKLESKFLNILLIITLIKIYISIN